METNTVTAVQAASPAPAVAANATLAVGESSVRIVRLSESRGTVSFDRRTDRGFEPAFANLPIIQGGRLRTAMGVAEVEFEDNSTLRLPPDTEVEFSVLKLGQDGARISSVRLVKGAMYVSLVKDQIKGTYNNFTVTFQNQQVALAPASHILLDLSGAQPRLAVMDGSVQVSDGTRTLTVAHKKGLLFDPTNQSEPKQVSSNTINLQNVLTDWDMRSVEYHSRAAGSAFRSASPYSYGVNDLSYYGAFTNIAGCGTMWQPYLASAGFDPFANGTWAYYPGAGYSFVSPYPWAWVPFHTGSWSYCGANGWGWQPSAGGGSWAGLNNTALNVNTPHGPTRLRPPATPTPLGTTLVPVHQSPLVSSEMDKSGAFVFRKDSAGLGVPRGTFSDLNRASAQALQHGSYSAPVQSNASVGSASGLGAGSVGGRSVSAAHAGTGVTSSSPGISSGGFGHGAGAGAGAGHGSSGGVAHH
jgi:hypothetical protein